MKINTEAQAVSKRIHAKHYLCRNPGAGAYRPQAAVIDAREEINRDGAATPVLHIAGRTS